MGVWENKFWENGISEKRYIRKMEFQEIGILGKRNFEKMGFQGDAILRKEVIGNGICGDWELDDVFLGTDILYNFYNLYFYWTIG